MNKTPGVYTTKQGGGYGDSRISLRGFDQRNTSFLINDQPVNDMENGWVYWSTGGVLQTSTRYPITERFRISKLVCNISRWNCFNFYKQLRFREGSSVQQVFGNDGYNKTTNIHSTGLNENGWVNICITFKVGR